MSKNCKVIATYFGPRRNKPNGIKDTIRFWENEILKYEMDVDPGVEMDTIIVNHDFGNKEVKNFLENIDGTKTTRGVIRVYHREWDNGIGGSFRSFGEAFKKYKNEYDYWFFTEDNVIILAENYFKLALDQFKKTKNCGYICCLRSGGLTRYKDKHCDGACGLTSSIILNKIHDKLGFLPYSKRAMDKRVQEGIKKNNLNIFKNQKEMSSQKNSWYLDFCYNGEIKFTNEIFKLGFKLEEVVYNGDFIKWNDKIESQLPWKK
jgi:hypothetical protein